MLKPTWMFMDCIRKQAHQCAQHMLKIVYKTWPKHQGEHLKKKKKKKKIEFPCCRKPLQSCTIITHVVMTLTKLGWFQHKSKYNFDFWKKNGNFWVSML